MLRTHHFIFDHQRRRMSYIASSSIVAHSGGCINYERHWHSQTLLLPTVTPTDFFSLAHLFHSSPFRTCIRVISYYFSPREFSRLLLGTAAFIPRPSSRLSLAFLNRRDISSVWPPIMGMHVKE